MPRARRFISLALLASMSVSILSCGDQAAPNEIVAAPQADLVGDLLAVARAAGGVDDREVVLLDDLLGGEDELGGERG